MRGSDHFEKEIAADIARSNDRYVQLVGPAGLDERGSLAMRWFIGMRILRNRKCPAGATGKFTIRSSVRLVEIDRDGAEFAELPFHLRPSFHVEGPGTGPGQNDVAIIEVGSERSERIGEPCD